MPLASTPLDGLSVLSRESYSRLEVLLIARNVQPAVDVGVDPARREIPLAETEATRHFLERQQRIEVRLDLVIAGQYPVTIERYVDRGLRERAGIAPRVIVEMKTPECGAAVGAVRRAHHTAAVDV